MLYTPTKVGPRTKKALQKAGITDTQYLRACQRLRYVGMELYYLAGRGGGWRLRQSFNEGRHVRRHVTPVTGNGARFIVTQH